MVRSQALTISGLAHAADVSVETVRFYQRRGLLAVPDGSTGVRRYDADALARLCFIRMAQRAGFTLAQIAQLLSLDAVADRAQVRALATDRIAALDAEIATLATAREALARLTRDCAADREGACPILTAFEQP